MIPPIVPAPKNSRAVGSVVATLLQNGGFSTVNVIDCCVTPSPALVPLVVSVTVPVPAAAGVSVTDTDSATR